MPNWCKVNLDISSDDSNLIADFSKALLSEGLFEYFKPNPNGTWQYEWSVQNWGVKWDVEGDTIQVVQEDDDRIIVEFDTAWSPPIEFFKHLESLNYNVFAMYHEEGMAYCGIYANGFDDYYEYGDLLPEEIKATIPKELDYCFSISEQVESRLDEP